VAFVALKRQRFGKVHLSPGDEVPQEAGRNYNLMERMGLIADLDAKVDSEAGALAAQKAAKARITQLEGLLAAANAEIAELRAPAEEKPEGEVDASAEAPAEPKPKARARSTK
jgi:hypothetical protein